MTFVPDGDTVRAVWRGNETWVRLLRINAPERDQPGYDPAREALRKLLARGPVFLEFENSGVPERDRYGRLLGYLFASGRNCNVELVREGWSRFWTKYGEGRLAGEFHRAEAEARAAPRGQWKAGRRLGR